MLNKNEKKNNIFASNQRLSPVSVQSHTFRTLLPGLTVDIQLLQQLLKRKEQLKYQEKFKI